MFDRIVGAFTFRKGVYAEVEQDQSFTQSAWLLVAVVAFLAQLGANVGASSIVGWLVGSVIGTVFAVAGFAGAAFVISWVGRSLFKATTDFSEMVRVLGLAYVWNVVGFLGILGLLGRLDCIVAPIGIVAWILGLIAWAVAAKEALDLDWVQTIITIILGFIVVMIVTFIAGLVLAALGFAAAGIGGVFSGQ